VGAEIYLEEDLSSDDAGHNKSDMRKGNPLVGDDDNAADIEDGDRVNEEDEDDEEESHH
jgi:hypothetical protein